MGRPEYRPAPMLPVRMSVFAEAESHCAVHSSLQNVPDSVYKNLNLGPPTCHRLLVGDPGGRARGPRTRTRPVCPDPPRPLGLAFRTTAPRALDGGLQVLTNPSAGWTHWTGGRL